MFLCIKNIVLWGALGRCCRYIDTGRSAKLMVVREMLCSVFYPGLDKYNKSIEAAPSRSYKEYSIGEKKKTLAAFAHQHGESKTATVLL